MRDKINVEKNSPDAERKLQKRLKIVSKKRQTRTEKRAAQDIRDNTETHRNKPAEQKNAAGQ